jgi:hypothetical protein
MVRMPIRREVFPEDWDPRPPRPPQDGRLRLMVFDDINSEEPRTIEMEGAREE